MNRGNQIAVWMRNAIDNFQVFEGSKHVSGDGCRRKRKNKKSVQDSMKKTTI